MKSKSYLILFIILYGIVLLVSIINKIDSRTIIKTDKTLEPGVQLAWDINRPKISSGINIYYSRLKIPNSKDISKTNPSNSENTKSEYVPYYKTGDNKGKIIVFSQY